VKHEYPDIAALAGRCTYDRQPQWWDENGVPRFAPHHPTLCPCIYAIEVVLLKISCQSCGQEFLVQLSVSEMTRVRHMRLYPKNPYRTLEDRVCDGSIHYGDPPRHDDNDNCGAGASMNCWDLAVVQFWRRTDEWIRKPELEIELPDMKEER
jgi:hypothetical protein